MTDSMAASIDNAPVLFRLAAQLAGCDEADLVKVRRGEGDSLVVILITGQKLIFDGGAVAQEMASGLGARLAAVLGQAPAPLPAEPANKPKRKPAA